MPQLTRRLATLIIGVVCLCAHSAIFAYQLRDIGIEFLGNPGTPTILFVNGLNNTKRQAADSSEALIESLHARGLPFGKYNIYHFHNPTEGVLDDVLGEVATQIKWSNDQLKLAGGVKGTYYRLLGNFYIAKVANSANSPPSVGRIEKLADRLAKEMVRILESSPGLVVVPHSQGNLYVEAAYAILVAQGRSDLTAKIRVVGVAPASATTPSDRYILSSEDKIITRNLKGLAIKFSLGTFTPLPANVTPCTEGLAACADQIDWSAIDKDGHDFQKVYLSEALKTSITSTPLPQVVYSLVKASLDELDAPTGSVVFARTATGEDIQLGVRGDSNFYIYYFLGYAQLANPPSQLNYWTATREFETVRLLKTSSAVPCAAISDNPTLVDDQGQSLVSLIQPRDEGEYCVFSTTRGANLVSPVRVGERVAGIALPPVGRAFTLAGSAQNGGRSVNGSNSADRAGGIAFQFCSGPCDQPLGEPSNTSVPYEQAFANAPGWQTDQPSNFYWNAANQTYFARTYSGAPPTRPNRYGMVRLPSFDPNRGFTLSWDQRLSNVSENAIVHFGLFSGDRLVGKSTYVALPPLTPKSTVNFGIGRALGTLQLHEFGIVDRSGASLGQGGSGGASIMQLGSWYRATITYNPVAGEVRLAVVDRLTGATTYALTRPVVGANAFDPDMQYLGVGNDPIGYAPGSTYSTTPNGYVEAEFDNISLTYLAAESSVVLSRTGTDEGIVLGSPSGFNQYFFMGYGQLASPPTSQGAWIAPRDFDTVRFKKTGGNATCARLAQENAGFLDENFGVFALTGGAEDGSYCVYGVLYQDGRRYVPAGARVTHISFPPFPTASGLSITFAGSASNQGKSTTGGETLERSGGVAFQLCSGPCDKPL